MQVSGSFLLLLIVSLFGLSGCAAPPASDAPLEGAMISKVAFLYVGPRTIDENRLRTHIRTIAGSRYVNERVDEDIKALYESGLVNQVRVLAEPKRGGVEVVYEVTTRPRMGPSPFVGNTVFSDERLAKEAGLRVGQKPDRSNVLAAARNVEAYYHANGYPRTQVSVKFEDGFGTNPNAFLQFIIEEGAASR
jgi:outer membrane protein insertion porin family